MGRRVCSETVDVSWPDEVVGAAVDEVGARVMARDRPRIAGPAVRHEVSGLIPGSTTRRGGGHASDRSGLVVQRLRGWVQCGADPLASARGAVMCACAHVWTTSAPAPATTPM